MQKPFDRSIGLVVVMTREERCRSHFFFSACGTGLLCDGAFPFKRLMGESVFLRTDRQIEPELSRPGMVSGQVDPEVGQVIRRH